jgi:multisubunit Na+/H+ antiporter MnhG subunit
MAVACIVGLLMLAEYFFSPVTLKTWGSEIQNWSVIIAAFALGLAAVGLIRVHARRVIEKRPESYNSVLLLAAMVITAVSGIAARQGPVFKFIFERMMTPLGAAFYAMVAYHLFSAAYRTFRARSGEAAALLVAGVIVMLGRAPIGEAIWSQFPVIADWIMKWPNLAGSRGVLVGAAVGTVGVGIRVILGIDRSYLGGE